MEQSAEESWGSSSGGGDFFSDAGLNSCGVWAAARGAANNTMQLNAVRAHTKASARLLRFRFIQATPRSRGTRVSYRITTRSPPRRKAWARVSLLRNRSHPCKKRRDGPPKNSKATPPRRKNARFAALASFCGESPRREG